MKISKSSMLKLFFFKDAFYKPNSSVTNQGKKRQGTKIIMIRSKKLGLT